jgi:predicted permease
MDPGFLIDDIATARIDPDPVRYPDADRPRLAAEALAAARAIPGVTAASLTSIIPLGGDVMERSYIAGNASTTRRDAYVMHVGPDYFETMGIALEHGREFTSSDRAGSPHVAVVSRAFVTAHGIAGNPLGTLVHGGGDEPALEIVGIVADSRYAFFGEHARPIVYRPFFQAGGGLHVVARGAAGPVSLKSALKRALTRLDPGVPIEAATMREATQLEHSARRIGWWILGGLGVLGLGLASIGLYGLMSYKVTRHTRELGIRMALGASRQQAQAFILRGAAVLVGSGAVAGTAAAFALTRPLAFLLNDTSVVDPWVAAATVSVVLGTGLAASYVPSLRATRVDPMAALRAA